MMGKNEYYQQKQPNFYNGTSINKHSIISGILRRISTLNKISVKNVFEK